jgi:Secretion system C-terminal sorting domain
VDVGNFATPTFVDIDNDGNQDAFIGEGGSSILYYRNGVVLPIEIISFFATQQSTQNMLTWTTTSEVNNKGFDIERKQGDTWENIGFTKAQGKAATYHFTDNTPLPISSGSAISISYYRLRQIDNDGKETLSKVVSVSMKSSSKLKAYPSVSSGLLTLETVENSIFHIYNLLGQEVLTAPSTRGAQQIDVSALAQGTYILKVGEERVTFMKQ